MSRNILALIFLSIALAAVLVSGQCSCPCASSSSTASGVTCPTLGSTQMQQNGNKFYLSEATYSATASYDGESAAVFLGPSFVRCSNGNTGGTTPVISTTECPGLTAITIYLDNTINCVDESDESGLAIVAQTSNVLYSE